MQLLSREKNQNSLDRGRVAHALIKHTVHVSTITLLRGFRFKHRAHYWELLYSIMLVLYHRAFGGDGGKLRTWEDTQENVLGSYTPTHFWIFPLVYTLTRSLFFASDNTYVCTHTHTHTAESIWYHLISALLEKSFLKTMLTFHINETHAPKQVAVCNPASWMFV